MSHSRKRTQNVARPPRQRLSLGRIGYHYSFDAAPREHMPRCVMFTPKSHCCRSAAYVVALPPLKHAYVVVLCRQLCCAWKTFTSAGCHYVIVLPTFYARVIAVIEDSDEHIVVVSIVLSLHYGSPTLSRHCFTAIIEYAVLIIDAATSGTQALAAARHYIRRNYVMLPFEPVTEIFHY